MKYEYLYRVPDDNDTGCCDTCNYLLVNSVGFYEFDSYFRMTHRKIGRKDFYLAYNLSGPMTVRIREKEYILQPGSLFLYRPFEEQYYGHSDEKSFFCYWVHFTGYGVEELILNSHLSEIYTLFIGSSSNITKIFEEMMNELRDKNEGFVLATSSLLSYLFSMISRQIKQGLNKKVSKSRNDIYDSLKYIHNNYSHEIYIQELAEKLHLSTDRFNTLFKLISGITPLQYIIKFRLQKACELMKHTNLNIQQISQIVGFEDQLYFSRMFKKHYSTTPTEYISRFIGNIMGAIIDS